MRYIDLTWYFLVERNGLHVTDNADNLARELLVAPHDDSLANRVLAWKDTARGSLIDDDDGRSLHRVMVGESAPGFNGNAHCLDVVARQDEKFRLEGFLGYERSSFGDE